MSLNLAVEMSMRVKKTIVYCISVSVLFQNSGWLFWSGSSEWRVVEAQWQCGNSRLLHDSSDVDTDLWSDRQMDRNVRQLHSTYDHDCVSNQSIIYDPI